MIASREWSTPKQAGRAFSEWAALFPDGIFVKAVIIYADESGTHDRTGNHH